MPATTRVLLTPAAMRRKACRFTLRGYPRPQPIGVTLRLEGVRPSGDTDEGAWDLFASFLQRAFKADEPQAIEVKSSPEGWDIVAANGEFQYRGSVDRSGKVLRARLVKHPTAD